MGMRVTATLPSDYRLALQALNKGRPLAMEDHSKLSDAYRELADHLAGIERQEGASRGGGIFGKLLGR
jgi:septum formation inhibitor-activating ATPase MinD